MPLLRAPGIPLQCLIGIPRSSQTFIQHLGQIVHGIRIPFVSGLLKITSCSVGLLQYHNSISVNFAQSIRGGSMAGCMGFGKPVDGFLALSLHTGFRQDRAQGKLRLAVAGRRRNSIGIAHRITITRPSTFARARQKIVRYRILSFCGSLQPFDSGLFISRHPAAGQQVDRSRHLGADMPLTSGLDKQLIRLGIVVRWAGLGQQPAEMVLAVAIIAAGFAAIGPG